MKTAGIVIDAYKLPVFQKHLNNAGFRFTQHAGPAPRTLTLKVECSMISDLKPIVEAANKEAGKKKS